MSVPFLTPTLKPECEALRTAVIGALLAERDIMFAKAGFAGRLMEKLYANLTDSGWEITKAAPKARDPGWYWVKLYPQEYARWVAVYFEGRAWINAGGQEIIGEPCKIGPRIEEPK